MVGTTCYSFQASEVKIVAVLFLAVQNSSIGDLVTNSLTDSVTKNFTNCHSKSDPREL